MGSPRQDDCAWRCVLQTVPQRFKSTSPLPEAAGRLKQGIGSDTGTPITFDYTPPFNFEGTLKEVVVEPNP